jgi:tetratricopeptide (TPR) repeat protein
MGKNLKTLVIAACLVAPSGLAIAGEGEKATVKSFQDALVRKKGIKKDDLENKMLGVRRHEYIHQALLKFNPAYKQANSLSKSEPLGVIAWTKVLQASPTKFEEAEARYRLGRSYLLAEEFEKAAEQFEMIDTKLSEFTTRNAEAHLFLAYSHGKLEDAPRAKRVLGDMLKEFPDAPERYQEMARWFLRELKGQGTGPLLELSKSMDAIRRLLKKGETGKNPTQDRQKRVVEELDRLIKMLEEQQKGGKGQGECKKCKGKGCKSCSKPGGKPGSKPGSKPMDDSKLPGGSSKVGSLKRDAGRGSKEAWGGLKKRERAKVLDILKERFPEQYKEIIEQYYKSINKSKSGK